MPGREGPPSCPVPPVPVRAAANGPAELQPLLTEVGPYGSVTFEQYLDATRAAGTVPYAGALRAYLRPRARR